ncbi:hypothetical protein [Agromyces bauzanensis]
MSDLEEPKTGVTRRTVAKAMAWSVPAVALAVPAPAYAASGGPPTVSVGDACKLPGNACGTLFVKGYLFEVTITNNTGKDIYLYDQAGYEILITEDSPDIDLFFQAAVDSTTGDPITFPYLLADGASITIILNAGENGNSQNVQDLSGTISIPWGHTPTPPDPDNHPPAVDDFSYASTPPYQNPACQLTLPPNCG